MAEDRELTAVLDRVFKFNIGDLVVLETHRKMIVADADINGTRRLTMFENLGAPIAEMIIERQVQQCHGGIQKFYYCRRVTTDGKEGLVRFTEFELAPYEEAVRLMTERNRRSEEARRAERDAGKEK